ncbi:MAG TPA: GGDEF domain-containing protein, partial [Thermodesulfobacteriota bacterium]|nr:GGDEF domain-containing protein [Thermodesulfobacteriota bacterium]
LLNEISHVGRDVDDFEATARELFRLLREIAPAEAMGAVFSDGVYSEGVSVFPDEAGDPFRAEVRQRTERLHDEARVPFAPDRVMWTGIRGRFRGSDGVAPGSLAPRAVCTVRAGKMVKGLMAVYSGTAGAPLGVAATREALLRQAFMVLENAWLYRQIARISVTDGLTGLTNVRHFREQAQREHSRARRHNDPYSVLMMDIDHFKKVNDVYGHPVGDTVLREMAAIFREAVRATDLPARYGGEEFVVLLPRTRLPEAATVGERIREAVERKVFAAPSPMIRCTVSVGIADYLPGTEGTEKTVIGRADQALYSAKRGGRNRVVCSPAKEV